MPITDGYSTLAQIKAFLGITDTADDTVLEFAVNAASRSVDHYCRRRFFLDGGATARVYRATTGGHLWVDDIGSATGVVVRTDSADNGTFDTTWTVDTDYVLEPADNLAQNRSVTKVVAVGTRTFPVTGRRSRVQVTARWGWPAVPDDVLQACLVQASRLFKRKDSPYGVAGFADYGVVRVSKLDPDIEMLLDEYRQVSVA